MVHAAQKAEAQAQPMELPILLDPSLMRSARRIYRTYCVLHPKQNRRPCGVAIHRDTHRGQLIFRDQPILLPGESFVPTRQLEAEIY